MAGFFKKLLGKGKTETEEKKVENTPQKTISEEQTQSLIDAMAGRSTEENPEAAQPKTEDDLFSVSLDDPRPSRKVENAAEEEKTEDADSEAEDDEDEDDDILGQFLTGLDELEKNDKEALDGLVDKIHEIGKQQ
jgi:hypothetical protein